MQLPYVTENYKGKTCRSVSFPYSSYLKIPWARLPDSDSKYENTEDFPPYVSQRLIEVISFSKYVFWSLK